MGIKELIEEDILDKVLYLPKRYDDCVMGADCVRDDRLCYDITKLNKKGKLLWKISYGWLKLKSLFTHLNTPWLVDVNGDPTGLEYCSGFKDEIIGVADKRYIVYDYDDLVRKSMKDGELEIEDARDWVDYNIIRAVPYDNMVSMIIFRNLEIYND